MIRVLGRSTSRTAAWITCLFLASGWKPATAANSTLPTFYIGVPGIGMLSIDQYLHFHVLAPGSKVALETGLLAEAIPNWQSFKVEFVNQQGYTVLDVPSASAALPTMMRGNMCQDPGSNVLTAVVGDQFSDVAKTFASVLGVFNVPNLANAVAEDLSQKSYYPYFVRSRSPGSVGGKVFAVVCNKFKWYKVLVVLETASSSSIAVKDAFVTHARSLSIKSSVDIMAYPPGMVKGQDHHRVGAVSNVTVFGHHYDEIVAWTETVASMEPRIIMPIGTAILHFFTVRFFSDAGLLGPGYVWLLEGITYFITFYMPATMEGYADIQDARAAQPNNPLWQYDFDSLHTRINGSLWVSPDAIGPLFWGKNWTALWSNMTSAKLYLQGGGLPYVMAKPWANGAPGAPAHAFSERTFYNRMLDPVYVPYLLQYEAPVVVYAAIGRLLAKNVSASDIKGKTLLQEILASDFESITGRITFDEKGDRLMRLNVYQIVPGKHPFNIHGNTTDNVVFAVDFVADTITAKGALRFAGGSAVPPKGEREPCGEGTEYLGRKLGCVACQPGYYNPIRNSGCLPCPAGQVTNTTNSVGCSSCQAGSFAANKGSSSCAACPGGTIAAKDGAFSCSTCMAGTYSHTGAIKCEFCQKGSYTMTEKMSACILCKPGMTTDSRGSTFKGQCLCPAGMYLPIMNDRCAPCPVGMTCPFGSSEGMFTSGVNVSGSFQTAMQLQLGYWSEAAEPLKIYRCVPEDWCPGGGLASCAKGRIGHICSECPSDHTWSSEEGCMPCTGGSGIWMYLMFPGIVIFGICFKYGSSMARNEKVSSVFTVGLVFYSIVTVVQLLGIFGLCTIPWPGQAGKTMNSMSIFVLNVDLLDPGCFVEDFKSSSSYALSAFVIPSVVLVMAIAHGLSQLVPKIAWNKQDTVHAMGSFLQASLATMAGIAVVPLVCYSHPSGNDDTSVIKYPGLTCWEGEHISFVIYGLLLFGIISLFVSACAYIAFAKIGTAARKRAFRFLFERFNFDHAWYGPLVMLRTLFYALTPAVSPDEPRTQMLIIVAITLVFLCFEVGTNPWSVPTLSFVNTVTSILLLILIVTASAFMAQAEGAVAEKYETVIIILLYTIYGFLGLALLAVGGNVLTRGPNAETPAIFFRDPRKAPNVDEVATSWASALELTNTLEIPDLRKILDGLQMREIRAIDNMSRCIKLNDELANRAQSTPRTEIEALRATNEGLLKELAVYQDKEKSVSVEVAV